MIISQKFLLRTAHVSDFLYNLIYRWILLNVSPEEIIVRLATIS